MLSGHSHLIMGSYKDALDSLLLEEENFLQKRAINGVVEKEAKTEKSKNCFFQICLNQVARNIKMFLQQCSEKIIVRPYYNF